jgi:DnaJ domain
MFGPLVLVVLACVGVLALVGQTGKKTPDSGNKLASFLTATVLLAILTAVFLTRGKFLFALPTLVGAVACGLTWQRLSKQLSQKKNSPDTAKIDQAEALAILGLKSGATADEIRSAHRRLIEQLHPDRGGNDYLAAKINRSRDILLKDEK